MDKTALQIIIERELIESSEPVINLINKITRKPKNVRGGKRSVRCINTGQEFESVGKAADYAKISSSSSLSKHLLKLQYLNGVGKHPKTGELLKWEYVDNQFFKGNIK